MKRKLISVLIMSAYLTILIVGVVFQDVNEHVGICALAALLLFINRIFMWNAQKPIESLFHGNPIKYRYQKRGRLKEYERDLKIFELIVLIILGINIVLGLLAWLVG